MLLEATSRQAKLILPAQGSQMQLEAEAHQQQSSGTPPAYCRQRLHRDELGRLTLCRQEHTALGLHARTRQVNSIITQARRCSPFQQSIVAHHSVLAHPQCYHTPFNTKASLGSQHPELNPQPQLCLTCVFWKYGLPSSSKLTITVSSGQWYWSPHMYESPCAPWQDRDKTTFLILHEPQQQVMMTHWR